MCVKRWTESAEEASSGAELVVEAILEDLQVRSFEALVDVVVDGGGVVFEAILEVLRFLLSLMMVVLMLLLLMVMVLLLRSSLKTSR